jgi:hypothetical protein
LSSPLQESDTQREPDGLRRWHKVSRFLVWCQWWTSFKFCFVM